MSCPLLEYVFTSAAKEAPPSPLEVQLYVQQGGIIIAGSMPTLTGSGSLAYTPYHLITFANSPFHFYGPPFFSGVIPCTATWQTPQGQQSSPQDVTIQIAAPFLLTGAYSVSLTSSTGAGIPINGTFEPSDCTWLYGENHGSLTGFIPESPIKMYLTFRFVR
jgi:hypothetical protein